MTEEKNKFTPKEIAESKKTYSIPIYQRLFEWEKENIETLLSDLKHSYENDESDYYIGMLTSTESNELVDGQQRFVVMTLMGCVFKDYYGEWKNFIQFGDNPRLDFPSRPDDNDYLVKLVNTDKCKTPNLKMENGIKTIKNFVNEKFKDTDKEDFAEYVYNHLCFFISELPKNYSPKDLNTYFERMNTSGKNLEQHEILKVKLLKHLNDSNECMRLWDKIADVDTELIRKRESKNKSESTHDFQKRKITALKTEVTDIIREMKDTNTTHPLLNDLKPIEENGEENGEYNKPIRGITFSSKKTSATTVTIRGERGPLTFPYLLLQVLYWYLDKKKLNIPNIDEFFKSSNLLQTFGKYLKYDEESDDVKENIYDFFEKLFWCRIVLDICFIRPTEEEDGYSLDMTWLEDGDEDKKRLLMFESMLYVNASNYTNYRWFGWLMDSVDEYLKNISSVEKLDKDDDIKDFAKNFAKYLLKKLKEKDNARAKDNHNVYEYVKNYDNEKKDNEDQKVKGEVLSFGKVDHYWFWRLDYYLWEDWVNLQDDKYNKAVECYVFRQNRSSIEHFHPQNESHYTNEKWKDPTAINSFGNLAMISQSFNSEQSNDPISTKMGRIEDQINKQSLQSIKLLKMYIDAKKNNNTWTIDMASKHEAEMIEVLKKSFIE